MKRFFLVGCARSGTTLLQSLLASHPEIASFPESEFFNHLFSHSEPRRNKLGLLSRRAKPKLLNFLKEIGQEDPSIPPYLLFPNQLTAYFTKTLDSLTAQDNKRIWIEKTPTHLYHLDYIEKRIPNAQFIHIIREGKDVVASLYDVRKKYPKQWANEPASIELSVDRWLIDTAISLQYTNSSNHVLVSYERLVENPQLVLSQLCEFIGIAFNEHMLNQYTSTAQQVSLDREPWKAGVATPICNANSTKFYSLFDEQQQAYILERTASIDLSCLQKATTTSTNRRNSRSNLPSAA